MSSPKNTNAKPSPMRTASGNARNKALSGRAIVPIVMIAISIVFFVGTWWIQDYGTDRVPPQFFPRAMAVLLLLTSITCALDWKNRKQGETIPFAMPSTAELRALATISALGITAILIPWTGFYVAAFLGLIAMLRVSGNRSLRVVVGAPIVILLFIFVVFDVLLSVPLPEWAF